MKKSFTVRRYGRGLLILFLVASVTLVVLVVQKNKAVDINGIEDRNLPDYYNSQDFTGDESSASAFNEGYGVDESRSLIETSDLMRVAGNEPIVQATESAYDTRDTITTVRTKNQGDEGICWAYSLSTTLEYYFAKRENIQIEFSPKVWDYRFVAAEDAYKEDNVENLYYNKLIEEYTSDARSLGGGERSVGYMQSLIFADPLALVSEPKFLNVLKRNDDRLEAIGINNTYDELWSKDYESVTNKINGWSVYDTKQSYAEVNSPANTDYIITGMERYMFSKFGVETDPDKPGITRSEVLQNIKNAIKNYGAVNTIYYQDAPSHDTVTVRTCSHASYPNMVHINKGSKVCTGSGHTLALVGWDDNLEYNDNGTMKKGAFIGQNSAGARTWKDYLSYDSIIAAYTFYDMERYDAHDHHYALPDYQMPVESTLTEHIFSLKTDGDEMIEAIVFTEGDSALRKFDIYLSSSETGDTYQKINTSPLSTHYGVNKYEFDRGIDVNGEFKIKMVKVEGDDIDLADRYYNNVIIFTNDNTNPTPTPDDPTPTPDDPTPTPDDPTPDDPSPIPDAPGVPDTPTPTSDDSAVGPEDDILVPNTSKSNDGMSAPDTGSWFGNEKKSIWGDIVVVPFSVVVVVIVVKCTKRNKRPKFERKEYEQGLKYMP